MLAKLLCWSSVHLVTEEWFKQKNCVRYFTKINFDCFTIWSMKKVDTVCWAYIHRTYEYLCHDLCSIFWFLINFIIKSLSSYGEVIRAYCSMTVPKSDFHSLRFFSKVYLPKNKTDVFIYWYWMNHDQILTVYVFINQSDTQMYFYFKYFKPEREFV